MSQQTVQTQIRLLRKEQSDQGLHSLPFQLYLLDTLLHCKIKLLHFHDRYGNYSGMPISDFLREIVCMH